MSSTSAQLTNWRQRVRGAFAQSGGWGSTRSPVIQNDLELEPESLTEDDALSILESVLDEIDLESPQLLPIEPAEPAEVAQVLPGVFPQVVSAVVAQVPDPLDPLNPPAPTSSQKEVVPATQNFVVEAGGAHGPVEIERSAEIPIEVENFVHEVENHEDQLPHEIVIADDTIQVIPSHYRAQPVVVVPITPEEEIEGKKKDYRWSLRWLVEWSQKVMKMFSGKVVYRQVPVDVGR